MGLGGQGLGREEARAGPEVSKRQGRPLTLPVSSWRALGSRALSNKTKGQQTFSIKGSIVILGFAGYVVPVAH